MGKMIMSELFTTKELDEIKGALLQHKNRLGEANTAKDPDHLALAKGLKVALADKAKAVAQVERMQALMNKIKRAHENNLKLTAQDLAGCKKHIRDMSSTSDVQSAKLGEMAVKLRKAQTQHDVSTVGHKVCSQRMASAEAEVARLKALAMKAANANAQERVVGLKSEEVATPQKTAQEAVTPQKTAQKVGGEQSCLLYTSPSPRDRTRSRMPSSA
eukprot:TRINITY_DN19147_c0_g1_i2.p1 TRINITY_DN19147_c0_g1~~TRINITY_DN19147_c0_g1_i2.p1  ORF type:complete len:216 (-),score=100.37 TRINITY_DN19147_c0_g1_i2:67-714(-)